MAIRIREPHQSQLRECARCKRRSRATKGLPDQPTAGQCRVTLESKFHVTGVMQVKTQHPRCDEESHHHLKDQDRPAARRDNE